MNSKFAFLKQELAITIGLLLIAIVFVPGFNLGNRLLGQAKILPVEPPQPEVRFTLVDLYVNPGETPLAAYQIRLKDPTGKVQIVGIEGGKHEAYKEPPFYDPKALTKNEIILAAFSTKKDLPKGKTLVARLHLQVEGKQDVDFQSQLIAAASSDGQKIKAQVQVEGAKNDEE